VLGDTGLFVATLPGAAFQAGGVSVLALAGFVESGLLVEAGGCVGNKSVSEGNCGAPFAARGTNCGEFDKSTCQLVKKNHAPASMTKNAMMG
jgi:hypothetical protein